MKILIVEDDQEISSLLKQVLEMESYTIFTKENGVEALDFLKKNAPPDLIIIDLIMPMMDGVEFRKNQLKDPLIASIPVLLMTADSNFSAADAELRAVDILKKPLSIDAVLKKIKDSTVDR